jgi:hypothetical protein
MARSSFAVDAPSLIGCDLPRVRRNGKPEFLTAPAEHRGGTAMKTQRIINHVVFYAIATMAMSMWLDVPAFDALLSGKPASIHAVIGDIALLAFASWFIPGAAMFAVAVSAILLAQCEIYPELWHGVGEALRPMRKQYATFEDH